jgi:hypothetical protein
MTIPTPFNTASTPQLSEVERALQEWKIAYTKRPDGTIFVPGSIDLNVKGLTTLPDLSQVVVQGDFCCANNQLTSLAGAPTSVGGEFWCTHNQLTSLRGAPASVAKEFNCGYNQLTSLEGVPQDTPRISSDFGYFEGWDKIPEEVRYSEHTRERMRQEAYVAATSASCNLTPLTFPIVRRRTK